MKFDELESRMRVLETAHDHSVLPGLLMVARIDGRSFTRLTRELQALQAPYDERFRDCIVAAVRRRLECGLGVI